MGITISELSYKPTGKPFVMGDDMKKTFKEILNFMVAFRVAIDLIGDPGTGKTHIGKEVAIEFGRIHSLPAYYTVTDEDTTKASLLMGHRLLNGSLETIAAVVGKAMETGGAVFVDELTHGQLSIQSIFNTVADQKSVTSVGDILLTAHPKFRLIFGHNTTQHPGNVGLKTSFAGRLMTWKFDYPEPKTEALIVKAIILQTENGQAWLSQIPEPLINYLVSWAREVRKVTHNFLPVSTRNVAQICMLMAILDRDPKAKIISKFTGGTSSEPIRKKIARWATFTEPQSDADLISPMVSAVISYISQMGEERFTEAVMQGSMYHLQLDGLLPTLLTEYHEQMRSCLI